MMSAPLIPVVDVERDALTFFSQMCLNFNL